MLCAVDLTEETNWKNYFVLKWVNPVTRCWGAGGVGGWWGRVNRRNERLIGGMKLAGPPCERPSKTPMLPIVFYKETPGDQ